MICLSPKYKNIASNASFHLMFDKCSALYKIQWKIQPLPCDRYALDSKYSTKLTKFAEGLILVNLFHLKLISVFTLSIYSTDLLYILDVVS